MLFISPLTRILLAGACRVKKLGSYEVKTVHSLTLSQFGLKLTMYTRVFSYGWPTEGNVGLTFYGASPFRPACQKGSQVRAPVRPFLTYWISSERDAVI